MKAVSLKPNDTPETLASEFIIGKVYAHPTGEIVNFGDAAWCICPARGKKVTVNFENLPEWLIRPAKLTIAHGWLSGGLSKSWLLSRMSAFRWVSERLENFEGASMAELTGDHAVMLQNRLASEVTRYNETLETLSQQLGRSAGYREIKRLCIQLKLLGPAGARHHVLTFNLAARLLNEIDGLAVGVRLQNPRELNGNELNRAVGSADQHKVLTPEQIAELERALVRDLRRYEKARALLDRELSHLDFSKIEQKRPDWLFNLEHYFGLNGIREHTTPEIAALRGLAPTGYPNIARGIKRFLSVRLGADLAAEVMTLRSQLGRRRQQKRHQETEAARERIHSILDGVDLSFREPKAFCIERYFGLHGVRPHSMSAIAKDLGVTSARPVFYHLREGLFSLIGERKGKRLFAIRERLRYYLTRAIKAQAVRLQIGAARRISAILEIPAAPKLKIHIVEARRVVEIQFRVGKTWGDEGLEEWVPCIDKFGEIAEDAIRTTQILTKDLRRVAAEEIREVLFLIPHNSFENVIPLSPKVLHEYIHTSQKGKDGGVLRRYGLEGLLNFELHHVRHTYTTHMVEEGGTIHDVAEYLGHTTFNGSTTMAGVFYLAGGTEAMRQRTAEALKRGAATGLLFDAVARIKIEAMDEEAKKATVPPNQLSFEQALQHVRSGDILEDIPANAEEAASLLNQKIVVNITRYGGCLLPATSGPCPTANPCPVGIVSMGDEPKPGCGCKYLVLMPHSADQLSTDIGMMEAQLAKMHGEEWVGWRRHTKAKSEHWMSLLEVAASLEKQSE